MPFKIERERRVPNGNISLSVLVDWGNPATGQSHEEIEVPADADDIAIHAAIRQKMRELRTSRQRSRPAIPSRHERRKEWDQLNAEEMADA